MKITLKEQECEGNYKFNGQIFYTRGIESMFGENVFLIIFQTMSQIKQLVEEGIADYFQVATVEHNGISKDIWCIDDIDHITFLLPQEY